jgi:hypothetical protein
VPGALGLFAAATAGFYKLGDAKMQEIESDLFARRSGGRTVLEEPKIAALVAGG